MKKPFINKSQLTKLLTIDRPHEQSIYEIVGRMEVLLDYFKQNDQFASLVPFLTTYYLVTKGVADKYITHKQYFHNLRDYEVLDVYFASLYFKPLLAFLTDGAMIPPWQQYLEYSKKPDGLPFLQILLGINAHINSDLYRAIVHLHFKNQNDFFLVNTILQETAPAVMSFLSTKHDVFGMTGLVFQGFMEKEFHKVIGRWRSEAWANALLTTPENKKENLEKILWQTENIGQTLIEDFKHPYRIDSIPHILAHLNKLSVSLV